MVEGGMKCVKYLLFLFNLIFFLAGLGLIIAGAVVQTKFDTYIDFFGGSFSAAAILLIVVGSIIFIIGFFGCCGAYKENYCMTMTFAVLLGVIFILEIAAGIAAYAMRNKVKNFVQEALDVSLNGYDNKEGIRKAWNIAQQDFHCCGVNDYKDWSNPAKAGDTNFTRNGDLPDSCCKDMETACGADMGKNFNNATMYEEGCLHGFENWVTENIYIVGGVGIGLAFVQVVGIILACCLARTIKKEYEVV